MPGLCNLPIWMWVWHGDEFVPLRQVRRALSTWAKAALNPTWSAAQETARDVSRKLSAPGTRRSVRKRFRTEIEWQLGGEFDAESLREAARDAIEGEGGLRGPVGAQLDAERYGLLPTARVHALNRLADATDEQFEIARRTYRASKASYAAERPRFATDPDLGHLFAETSVDDEVNSACIDFVTVLGFVLLAEDVEHK